MLKIIQIPVLNDNYIYLLHEPDNQETAVIDPAVAEPVLAVLQANNWSLRYIFNTHHHWDHVGANQELKDKTGCKVLASEYDQSRIPGINRVLRDNERIILGKQSATVLYTPGHTLGHIVYHFAESNALFCGDTIFSMGCGRLFEGTAEQMWQSLQKIKQLPAQTQIYCAHEYTKNNGQFALTLEPNNQSLLQRIQQVNQLRKEGRPTIPCSIGLELSSNPFLREDSPELQQNLGMMGQDPVDIFRQIRKLKDNF